MWYECFFRSRLLCLIEFEVTQCRWGISPKTGRRGGGTGNVNLDWHWGDCRSHRFVGAGQDETFEGLPLTSSLFLTVWVRLGTARSMSWKCSPEKCFVELRVIAEGYLAKMRRKLVRRENRRPGGSSLLKDKYLSPARAGSDFKSEQHPTLTQHPHRV